ncbi:MAG TPA: YwqG family protein [Ktedonobacterales bacterium]
MGRPEDAALAIALAERLRANNLTRMVDAVLALAQPAIRLDLTRVDDAAELPLGASKVGGAPDLPPDAAWPATSAGQLLPFIAQLRLADVAPFDLEGDLPHTGLLSFFYAMNDADGEYRIEDDSTAWRAIWTPDDDASLIRLDTPQALREALDSYFPACSVAFSRRLTLPGTESYAIQQLGFTNDERIGYINITTGSDVGYLAEMDLRLLGYPYELEPGTFTDAFRVAHGEPSPVYEQTGEQQEQRRAMERMQQAATRWVAPPEGYANNFQRARALWGLWHDIDKDDRKLILSMSRPQPTPPEVLQAMAERQRAIEGEWRLLFQVYSNEEAEMDWAGGGVIHFGVTRDALAVRDFSKVWVNLQSL